MREEGGSERLKKQTKIMRWKEDMIKIQSHEEQFFKTERKIQRDTYIDKSETARERKDRER